MADGMEIAPNYTIPALPAFSAVAPLVLAPPASDGRIWPLGSTGTAVGQALTPQNPRMEVPITNTTINYFWP